MLPSLWIVAENWRWSGSAAVPRFARGNQSDVTSVVSLQRGSGILLVLNEQKNKKEEGLVAMGTRGGRR